LFIYLNLDIVKKALINKTFRKVNYYIRRWWNS